MRFLEIQDLQNTADTSVSKPLSSGGMLLGVRRKQTSRWTETETSAAVGGKSQRKQYRFLPAIAAAPGPNGPDRHGNSRNGLAELVVMARPLHVEGSWVSSLNKRNMQMVTCLDDDTLQQWLPTGAEAEVVLVNRVTNFHLGLSANRWLKIRMREIAGGVGGMGGFERNFEEGGGAADACNPAINATESTKYFSDFFRDTSLLFDQTAPPSDPPIGASYEFEHWVAGGNIGVLGQVTGYE